VTELAKPLPACVGAFAYVMVLSAGLDVGKMAMSCTTILRMEIVV
jgi:hypothetical protein